MLTYLSTSPEPFYIYSTVKILAVPAITLSNGQSACATADTSTDFTHRGTNGRTFTEAISTLPSGNPKVYEYFDGHISSGTSTSLPAHDLRQNSALLPDIDAAETTLVLGTPYIYFLNLSDYGFEDYGYIPQALIELIIQSPDFTSSFPSHASFLPGGPSISAQGLIDLPVIQSLAEDLTVFTAFTVTSAGCFHPDACRLHDIQGTTTSVSPTAHNSIRSPAFRAGVPTQAVKTTSPPGPKNAQRETFTLLSTATSTGSATKEFPPAITSTIADYSGGAKISAADSPPPILVITLGSLIVTANSAFEFELGSQTLAPGGDSVLFSSTTYSLAPSATAIVVNGVSSALIPVRFQGPRPVMTDDSDALSHFADELDIENSNNASPYVVGGKTVVPGFAPIIVTYSLDSPASTIFVNNIASPLPKFQESHPRFAPVLSIGSQRFTANAASEYIVGGQTLSPGGSPIIVSGTTYSLAGQASALVINGVTSALPVYQQTNLPSRRVLSIGSLRLTADARSKYILESQTLSPGGRPIVVSGTTYDLGSQASVLVINGVTSSLPAEQGAKPTPGPIIKIGSQYLTADPGFRYVLNGETLISNGRPIVVAGTTYSLAPEASALMVNGVKIILPGPETLPTISSMSTPTSYQLDYIVGS